MRGVVERPDGLRYRADPVDEEGERSLLASPATPYVSGDDGETFAPSHADVAVRQVWWTRVGYLATVKAQSAAYLSEDGRRWRKITVA